MTPYVAPEYEAARFNCPHCLAYSHHDWQDMYAATAHDGPQTMGSGVLKIGGLVRSVCTSCEKYSLWCHERLIYPDVSTAEPPNPDLPEDIRRDYEEAASIVNKSPRGAAALLRLSIQKLCGELGENGMNINDDIRNLVSKGLAPGIQQALDSVRVIGNEAVHPGELDLRDDVDTARSLFRCVNYIAQQMITQPKELQALYETLPESKLAQIEKRDGAGP